MKIVTAAEMREIDRLTSERFGVPSLTLMDNAGTAVAQFALRHYSPDHVAILCGKGNNGGDGFVAARVLHQAGVHVSVILLAEAMELRGDTVVQFSKLPVKPIYATREQDFASDQVRDAIASADLLIDAIFGTGFQPPLREIYQHGVELLNNSAKPVLAIDIPSGIDADATSLSEPRARADAVLTFTAPKPAHLLPGLCDGPIAVVDIGSPAAAITSTHPAELSTLRDFAALLAPRARDAHKGHFGHVLVIGGSVGKAGAAAMAGIAALRSGAGLVTVACPKSVLPTVAAFAPELMTEPLDETDAGTISLRALQYSRLDDLAKGKSVVAIGPGISRHVESAELVRTLVSKLDLPIVLDADGLNAFEGRASELRSARAPLVLTPHPGEMSRLTGASTADIQRDRISTARRFAQQSNAIVALKGHNTVLASPDGACFLNPTGNPGMATGGSGDVLTGLAASLLAQHPSDPLRATLASVYLHGLAGDLAAADVGERSLIATDLIRKLPDAFSLAADELRGPFTYLRR